MPTKKVVKPRVFSSVEEMQLYIKTQRPSRNQVFIVGVEKYSYSPWVNAVDIDGCGIWKNQITGQEVLKLGTFATETSYKDVLW